MLVVLGYEQLFNFRLLGEKTPSLPSGLEWWDKKHLTRPKSDRFLQTLCNCKRMEHEHQACCNFYIVAFHQSVDCLKMKIFRNKASINSSGFEIFFNHPQVWPPPRIPHVLTWPKVGATSSASQLGPVKGWKRQEKMGQISEYGCFRK